MTIHIGSSLFKIERLRSMDYIQNRLLVNIENTMDREMPTRYSTIAGLYRILIEYHMYLLFACEWDRKRDLITLEYQRSIAKDMQKMSLGTILSHIIKLDQVGNEHLITDLDRYESLVRDFVNKRNKYFGHGMVAPLVQEKAYENVGADLKGIWEHIQALKIPIISDECSIYYKEPSMSGRQVVIFDNYGFKYKKLDPKFISENDFQDNNVYYLCSEGIYTISPFITIKRNEQDDFDMLCFRSCKINNDLFSYSKILDKNENPFTDIQFKGYFQSLQREKEHIINKANGVVCNKFDNNFDYFINVNPITGHLTKVWNFIVKQRSNTCMTIRGGGGIGKTALVQFLCTKHIFDPIDNVPFHYVIFCSAKDRKLVQARQLYGKIQRISGESVVYTYGDILKIISWVLDLEPNVQEDSLKYAEIIERELINTRGVLLIFDDFESIDHIEQKKVIELIKKLNVDYHKVIITTRSQYMVGEEYYIEPLNNQEILQFLKENFKHMDEENETHYFDSFVSFAKDSEHKKKVYELSKGTPLLSLQLSRLLILKDFSEEAVAKKWNDEVEEFLLGRLYSYFTTDTSRILYIIISQFYQYQGTEIFLDGIEILYQLYCCWYGTDNVDFLEDLQQLRKLTLIYIESDSVKVCNDISRRTLEDCCKQLKDKISGDCDIYFDEILVKNIVDYGTMKGVLNYITEYDGLISYIFIQKFALENILRYTNDDRFKIIETYIKALNEVKHEESIKKFYTESLIYFRREDNYNDFFGSLGRKYGFYLSELDWRTGRVTEETEITPGYLISKICEDMNALIDKQEKFEIEKRKRGKNMQQSYIIQMTLDIRNRFDGIIRNQLVQLLSMNLEGYEDKLMEISENIEEFAYYKEYEIIKDMEPVKRLREVLTNIV